MPQPQTRLNPLTALVIGASGWILALGINTPIASLAIIAAALTAGTWRTRNPSVAAATALLAAPVAASMVRYSRAWPGDTSRPGRNFSTLGLGVGSVWMNMSGRCARRRRLSRPV